MKKMFTILFFSFLFFPAQLPASLTGEQIIRKAKEQCSFEYEYKHMQMILTNRNGHTRVREVSFFFKDAKRFS